MLERPEWVKCVRMGLMNEPDRTWCGESSTRWDFVDAGHAALNGFHGGRLVCCPDCSKAISHCLTSGQEDIENA